jgi:hypothetical protein
MALVHYSLFKGLAFGDIFCIEGCIWWWFRSSCSFFCYASLMSRQVLDVMLVQMLGATIIFLILIYSLCPKKWRVEDIPHTMELIASPAGSPKRLPKGLLDVSDKKPRRSARRKWVFGLARPNKLFDAPGRPSSTGGMMGAPDMSDKDRWDTPVIGRDKHYFPFHPIFPFHFFRARHYIFPPRNFSFPPP